MRGSTVIPGDFYTKIYNIIISYGLHKASVSGNPIPLGVGMGGQLTLQPLSLISDIYHKFLYSYGADH